MHVGGFQKVSFVDFPGTIASTIFLSGCNLNCGYCHNPDLARGAVANLSLDGIFEYLKLSKGKKIDGVCICGGEPTIQKGIENLCQKIKDSGLKVKLDTNGLRLDVLKNCSVDYIAMDFKTSPDRYSELGLVKNVKSKFLDSLNWLIQKSEMKYEVRTTLVPGLVEKSEIKEMAKYMEGVRKWVLQPFRNMRTLDPSFGKRVPFTVLEENELLKEAQKYVENVSLLR